MMVIDANVAAKWYVREPGSMEAKAFLRLQEKLIAPEIIKLEVLGTISRTVREKRAKKDECAAWCQLWLSHVEDRIIELWDYNELLEDAIALSIQTQHHLYDCFYLVVCRRSNATLITFDDRLSKVAKQLGLAFELLREPATN